MPLYESIFIARQDVPTTQVEALTKIFSDIIVKDKGLVTKTEPWGLRNLAYRINKNKKGHYVLLNIDAPPAAIAEMERNMKLNEDVLRFMTVRVEEHEVGPSAILRKDERSERPSFGGDRSDRGGDRSDRPRRAPHVDATPSEGEVV
ncbi:MAG: 30S ribosomal protein S6 [Bdellovibrionales bacterium]|jgi:small subunit ribosomal protein S6